MASKKKTRFEMGRFMTGMFAWCLVLLATVGLAGNLDGSEDGAPGSEDPGSVSACSDSTPQSDSINQPLGIVRIHDPQPYFRDSGMLDNGTSTSRGLHRETVSVKNAAWLRIYFGDVELGRGSFVRITSKQDGEVQNLDAKTLEMWGNASAYFNGEEVDVELVGGPNTTKNRLVIDKINWELDEAASGCVWPCAVSGIDNRVPSDEDWAARLMGTNSNGTHWYCSAALYTTSSCFVSAGHCVGGAQMVLQFRVPPSTGNGSPQHPSPDDQFPVLMDYEHENNGAGHDWAVLKTGPNNTGPEGEMPYERYGVLRPVNPVNPSAGQSVSVWGYGIDPYQPTRNLTQQTASGSIVGVGSTYFTQFVDMSCANSGSSIIQNGKIMGIFTHCGYPSYSTRIDVGDFTAARASYCPEVCGNGIRDYGEECDGDDLGGATCMDESCQGGTPACTSNCTLDYTTCCCWDDTVTASWDRGGFKGAESAYDGDENTYGKGAYGGNSPDTVSHLFGFTNVGTRSGHLRAVISNYDPLGSDSLTSVEYSLDAGANFILFGSTDDDTPEVFSEDLVNVDMSTLHVRVTGVTNLANPPAGQARVYEIDFTYDDDPDGDGIEEGDNCPCDYNPDQYDYDEDGFGLVCDNCPFFYSLDQDDDNDNGIGDVCECKNDAQCNDGIACTLDKCLFEVGGLIGRCKITSEGCE